MQNGSGRIFFLIMSLAAGIMLTLAVFQVSQPWRGVLVAWLLVCATLGALVVRLLKHHYEFRALQQRRYGSRQERQAPSASPPPSFEGLKVVVSSERGQRYTI